ncbi:MAG: hypothetical protein IBX64_10500 [Actinobacteria bacterium]|nr:hypothetical protein [Actinomycetota bacterium]
MDDSLITVAIVGVIAVFALIIFIRGIMNFLREGRDQGGTEPIKDTFVEPKKIITAVKEPEVTTAIKKTEATANVKVEEPAKKTDWPPVRVQGPSKESEGRIAEIQQIIAKYM